MQIRRFVLGLTALASMTAAPASAQDRGPGMMSRLEAVTDSIVARMSLEGEQETAFRSVMAEQAEGIKKIFDSYGGQRDPAMREDMMALREETNGKLAEIFSDDQMAEYRRITQELRARMRERPGQGRPGGR